MSDARIVDGPLNNAPHECAVSKSANGPFIDFNVDCKGIDPHIYIKASLIEDVARELLGMVPKKDVDALADQLEAAQARLEKLERTDEAIKELETATKELTAA